MGCENCCHLTVVGLHDTCPRIAQVRRVHSDSKSCLLPQGTNTVGRACHTPAGHVSCVGARYPRHCTYATYSDVNHCTCTDILSAILCILLIPLSAVVHTLLLFCQTLYLHYVYRCMFTIYYSFSNCTYIIYSYVSHCMYSMCFVVILPTLYSLSSVS